jgi:acetyl-CoA carboxylase carboxyltransferase component
MIRLLYGTCTGGQGYIVCTEDQIPMWTERLTKVYGPLVYIRTEAAWQVAGMWV